VGRLPHWAADSNRVGPVFHFGAAPGSETDAARERPKEATCWIDVTAAAAPEPLKPDDLPLGGKQTLAWPMDPETKTLRNGSRLNKVLLLRLDPEGFDAETKQRAAYGVVGYSAICPHTGCDVINWHPDRQLLECPCHFSIYDPKEEANVVSGPSPRSPAGPAIEDCRWKARCRETVHRPARLPTNVTAIQ
jgi:rieske iron-sulfur protein